VTITSLFLALAISLALTGLRDPWAELAAMAAASLAASLILLRERPAGLFTPASLAVPVLLAVPAVIGVAQLYWLGTEDVSATETRVVKWISASVFAAAVACCPRPRKLFDLLVGTGALVAIAGVAYAHATGGGWPFANRNHLAAWCVLLFPLAAVGHPRLTVSWRTGAAAALALCGMLAGSRAGFALVVGEMVLLLFLAAPRKGERARPRWIRAGLAVAASAILLLCLLPGGAWQRWREAPLLLYRDQIWAASTDLFREKPWSGHGLGSFRAVYPSRARFDTGETVNRAHNDWLEWLVEGGILMPIPFAALGVLVLIQLRQRPWVLGVPMVLVHSVVDYPLDRFILLLLLSLLTTLALAPHTPSSRSERHRSARKKLKPAPVSELESFRESALQ
jgi:O-antigen ligase